jgi:hypothetical protein
MVAAADRIGEACAKSNAYGIARKHWAARVHQSFTTNLSNGYVTEFASVMSGAFNGCLEFNGADFT